jgi:hypothetical protein
MVLKWVATHITPIKNFLQQHVDHPIANKAVEIANSIGLWNDRGGKASP